MNPAPQKKQNSFLYLIIIALVISAGFLLWSRNAEISTKVSLNTVIQEAKDGKIEAINVVKNQLDITRTDGSKEYAYKEGSQDLYDLLDKGGVSKDQVAQMKIEVTPTESSDFWLNLIMSAFPIILIVAVLAYMMKQAQSSNNQAMSFSKSKAKLYDKEKGKTTFEDVAGAEEAKQELVEIVDFLKNPGKYLEIGAKIPKGVLLVGSPGTGKTLLARAVAGEAGVPFFSISGSEFVEMFVGVGASRVRDLFKKAARNAPCIIFIDEIDAVGRHRGAGVGGGHDEREQTLNQILTEMDGFEKDTNIIVMAATNRPDILDPALLRPGRFDRRVVVDLPDLSDRIAILKVHGRNKPLSDNVDLEKIAKHTPGFSGADLENLMNEAAILAARHNRKTIVMDDLEKSIEKVLMGPERKSRVLNEKEKKITAFHEVGHAIVGHLTENCDPVQKISIVSRGMALGVTWFVPDEDKHLYARAKFIDEMASLLGGYCAEEVFFGDVTTGASNDLEKATNIARRMVTEYGMSDLGQVIYGEKNHEVFIGRDLGHTKNYSESMAQKIDEAVKKYVDEAYKRAKETITKNKKTMEKIAAELIEKETLSRDEFLAHFDSPEKELEKEQKKDAEKKGKVA